MRPMRVPACAAATDGVVRGGLQRDLLQHLLWRTPLVLANGCWMHAVRRRKAPTRDTASATTTERRFGKRYAGVCNSERRTRRAIGIGVARAASNVDKYVKLYAGVHNLPLRGAPVVWTRSRKVRSVKYI